MNLLDAFLVHGIHNILCQHHISKAWMCCLSPFVVVQVLEAYVVTGKIMAQTVPGFGAGRDVFVLPDIVESGHG